MDSSSPACIFNGLSAWLQSAGNMQHGSSAQLQSRAKVKVKPKLRAMMGAVLCSACGIGSWSQAVEEKFEKKKAVQRAVVKAASTKMKRQAPVAPALLSKYKVRLRD